MSDDGKVVIGTDGKFLRSPDGEIVLADNLYPMVPIQQQHLFNRYIGGVERPDYAATKIWDEAWSEVSNYQTPMVYWWSFSTPNYSSARQVARQTTFEIGEGITDYIDWPRVKKLTQRLVVGNSSYPLLRVTTAMDSASIPTGFAIRDSWTFVANTGYTLGTIITLEWVIDGVKPTSVEFAVAYEADTSNPSAGGSATADPVRVVYNLES